MIYTIGDSHSFFCFKNIPGIKCNHIGPITMKRVGYEEDVVLLNTIAKINPLKDDMLILSFGEIDIRCYVKPNLDRLKIDLCELLRNWVERYLNQVCKINMQYCVKIYIMSIVPPSCFDMAKCIPFPVTGTDKERSEYTSEINKIILEECKKRNLEFLDIYSKYKDENGMLPEMHSDYSAHINNNKYIYDLLIEIGLLQKKED